MLNARVASVQFLVIIFFRSTSGHRPSLSTQLAWRCRSSPREYIESRSTKIYIHILYTVSLASEFYFLFLLFKIFLVLTKWFFFLSFGLEGWHRRYNAPNGMRVLRKWLRPLPPQVLLLLHVVDDVTDRSVACTPADDAATRARERSLTITERVACWSVLMPDIVLLCCRSSWQHNTSRTQPNHCANPPHAIQFSILF